MEAGVLLADVGGSSSRWVWLDRERALRLGDGDPWPGANMATGDAAALLARLRPALTECPSIAEVHVYAAGCGTPSRAGRLRDALMPLCAGTPIHVEDDLLGAARACWSDQAGHVLILGTGMNAGAYDGAVITHRLPSLGWILGDEGSGADLGKQLLRDALLGRMPDAIRCALFGTDGPDREQVLEELHRGTAPAAFVARPVALLGNQRSHPYVAALIRDRVDRLAGILHQHLHATGATFRAVGSVAAGFQDELRVALSGIGAILDAVTADPMEGLIAYHQRRVRVWSSGRRPQAG